MGRPLQWSIGGALLLVSAFAVWLSSQPPDPPDVVQRSPTPNGPQRLETVFADSTPRRTPAAAATKSGVTVVVRDERGDLVPGVTVWIHVVGKPGRELGRSNQDGEIQVRHAGEFADTEVHVSVEPPQALHTDPLPRFPASGTWCVRVWSVLSTVRGFVVATDGQPIAGAFVRGPTMRVRSTDDGRFELPIHRSFEPEPFEVKASARGFLPTTLDAPEDGSRMRIELDTNQVLFEVLREDGVPVGAFRVLGPVASEPHGAGTALLRGAQVDARIRAVPLVEPWPWMQDGWISLDEDAIAGGRVRVTVATTRRVQVTVRVGGVPARGASVGVVGVHPFAFKSTGSRTRESRIVPAVADLVHTRGTSRTCSDGTRTLGAPRGACTIWATLDGTDVETTHCAAGADRVTVAFQSRTPRRFDLGATLMREFEASHGQGVHLRLKSRDPRRTFASELADANGYGIVKCPVGRYAVRLRVDFIHPSSSFLGSYDWGEIRVADADGSLRLPPIDDLPFEHCILTFTGEIGDDAVETVSIPDAGFREAPGASGAVRLCLSEGRDRRVFVSTRDAMYRGTFDVGRGAGVRTIRVALEEI